MLSSLTFLATVVVVVVAVVEAAVDQLGHTTVTREFCQWQTLDVNCTEGHVILVQSSRYGRMKIGHCVAKNYGYVGCSDDVIGHVASLCSGRPSCQFEVPNERLKQLQPCPKDFASYLEISYVCVPVVTGSRVDCSGPNPHLISPVSGTGYLSNVITDHTGVGSADCPWLLQAGPGQRISLSLLDFSTTGSRSSAPSSAENEALPKPPPSSQRCVRLAVVRGVVSNAGYRRGDREICSVRPGDGGRERSVYLSASNELEVTIAWRRRTAANNNDVDDDHDAIFLLRYDVIGCARPVSPPAGGWMQLMGDDVIVSGCNASSLSHVRRQMRCEGSQWSGEFINCTTTLARILMVSAIGVALGLIVGIALLCVVIVFLRRRRSSCLEPTAAEYGPASPDFVDDAGSFAIHQMAAPTSRHCYKTPTCDECNKLELVALQDAGSQFYGAVWHRSGTSCCDESAPPPDYDGPAVLRPPCTPLARKYRFVVGPGVAVDGSAEVPAAAITSGSAPHMYETPLLREPADMTSFVGGGAHNLASVNS